MTLSREEILGQVSGAIDAAEKRAAEIEREARERAEATLAEARAEAKRILDRAQSAVAGLAAEIGGEVPEPPAARPPGAARAPPDPVPEPQPPAIPSPARTRPGADAAARAPLRGAAPGRG